jgi:hypothetical protein
MSGKYWDDDYGQWPEGHEFDGDRGRFRFVAGGSSHPASHLHYGGSDPIAGSQGGGYVGSDFGHGGGYGAQGYGSSHGETAGRGEVVPGRRAPRAYRRTDARIREDVCERYAHANDLDPSDVTVHVHGGVITLEGSVPQRAMKHALEDIAVQCYGVVEVENRVRVDSREA